MTNEDVDDFFLFKQFFVCGKIIFFVDVLVDSKEKVVVKTCRGYKNEVDFNHHRSLLLFPAPWHTGGPPTSNRMTFPPHSPPKHKKYNHKQQQPSKTRSKDHSDYKRCVCVSVCAVILFYDEKNSCCFQRGNKRKRVKLRNCNYNRLRVSSSSSSSSSW